MPETRSYSRPPKRNEANYSAYIALQMHKIPFIVIENNPEIIDIRNQTGANIIGLRRTDRTYVINPSRDVVLSSSVKLFVLGAIVQIKKLKNLLVTNPPSRY